MDTLSALPVGALLADPSPAPLPPRTPLHGRSVALLPLEPARHASGLYAASHGRPGDEAIWTYLAYGPFAGLDEMARWLEKCAASADPLWFTVIDQASGDPAGLVSFMSIVPAARRLELGHIWLGRPWQRSGTLTESIYLMLCRSFDELGYRRVEWKCDSLNARSRAAALRLGFRYEGLFRQHVIVKGRNRDTTWFALLDGEWPAVKANFERWLYSGEAGLSLAALNRA